MAGRLFTFVRPHPLPVAFGLGVSAFIAVQRSQPHPFRHLLIHADSSPPAGAAIDRYQSEAKVPVIEQGRLNPRAVKQISAGSITGFLGGLAVSVFSKPLAVLIGLLVVGVQALESRGIHIIPYSRLSRFFFDTDVRSAIQDNVAFKLCFGTTFALAGFAEF